MEQNNLVRRDIKFTDLFKGLDTASLERSAPIQVSDCLCWGLPDCSAENDWNFPPLT